MHSEDELFSQSHVSKCLFIVFPVSSSQSSPGYSWHFYLDLIIFQVDIQYPKNIQSQFFPIYHPCDNGIYCKHHYNTMHRHTFLSVHHHLCSFLFVLLNIFSYPPWLIKYISTWGTCHFIFPNPSIVTEALVAWIITIPSVSIFPCFSIIIFAAFVCQPFILCSICTVEC